MTVSRTIINEDNSIFVEIGLLDALRLDRRNSGTFMRAMVNILQIVTTYSKSEILSLSLTDATYLLVKYRILFSAQFPIYEESGVSIYPMELINKNFDNQDVEDMVIIGGEVFTTNLPMSECLLAEEFAVANGKLEDFPFYIASCGCENGFAVGFKTLENTKRVHISKGSYYEYLSMLENDCRVSINLRGEKIKGENNKYHPLLLRLNKNEKDEIKEFPFRSSRLFTN